jgi:hypothetical protein
MEKSYELISRDNDIYTLERVGGVSSKQYSLKGVTHLRFGRNIMGEIVFVDPSGGPYIGVDRILEGIGKVSDISNTNKSILITFK